MGLYTERIDRLQKVRREIFHLMTDGVISRADFNSITGRLSKNIYRFVYKEDKHQKQTAEQS
jgi:c-di-GMP-binding flagellar brake protein YcgR